MYLPATFLAEYGCVYMTLIATFTVRLVGGTSPYEGRLEVLHDGVWGTVCDNGFTVDAAKVACGSIDLRYRLQSLYERYVRRLGTLYIIVQSAYAESYC